MTKLVKATEGHARIIATQMRESDRHEILAGWDQEPYEAMLTALWNSSCYARTVFHGLEPLAMFGISHLSILGNSAQAWCFGTTAIDRHPLVFARASKQILPEIHARAPILTNWVDATDERALRWLAFMGATYVMQPVTRGGRLFSQFILAAPEIKQCQQV